MAAGEGEPEVRLWGRVRTPTEVYVERHARDFMEAAKKLQSYFICLQRKDQPTTEEMLRKVRLADPDIVSDPSEYQKLAHPVAELDEVVTKYKQFKDCERQIEETKALQKENGDDPDMAEMIASELESLSSQLAELEEKLKKWSSRLVTSRSRDRSLEHLNHEES